MSKIILKNSEVEDLPKPISTKCCVACHESIHAKANKCRHCGTDQQPKPWHSMAQVLKWIGGVTAVVSLVIGTSRVDDLFSDWQERKVAVSQLVNAATLQADFSDYKGAWILIEEALSFNASSQLARQQRTTIAMAWVRNIRTHGNETFSNSIDKLIPTLYQGSVNEDPGIASNALAHIGWANFLRDRDGITGLEIEEYYKRALKLNPDNVYAHAMWAHWILWPRNKKPNQGTDLVLANSHFAAALETGDDHEFARELQVSALINADYDTKTKIELIKVAEEIRQHNEMLDGDSRSRVFRVFVDIVAPRNLLDQSTQAIFNQLTEAFSPIILLELSEWLDTENKFKGTPNKMMINARLEELAGNREKALSLYHLLTASSSRARSSYKEFSRQAIKRLSGIN